MIRPQQCAFPEGRFKAHHDHGLDQVDIVRPRWLFGWVYFATTSMLGVVSIPI